MTKEIHMPPHQHKKHGLADGWAVRENISLTGGRVSDVFRMVGGPCVILSMFMEISEALENVPVNMTWVLHSDNGGDDRLIGDVVNIQAAALGDFYWAELDGTAIVKATTGTGAIHGGYDCYQQILTGATNVGGRGTIVPLGGICVALDASPVTGKAMLWVFYKPLVNNAVIAAEDLA